ncbi:MAG: queuosine salvage family protein [Nanoarchaeota archaeon]
MKIDRFAIERFVEDHSGQFKHWLDESPFRIQDLNERDRLHFLLTFNAVSFSYWGSPKWTVEHKGKMYDGSWGMVISLGRALEEGRDITDPHYLSSMSEEEWGIITRGNVPIPLAQERCQNLREIGGILIEKYEGDFNNLVSSTDRDAVSLVDKIVEEFPCFRDESLYKGRIVRFYKRAQVLVGDIEWMYRGKEGLEITGTERLTACTDYKDPFILRANDILVYSPTLAEKVDSYQEIPKGSDEEIEIRSNTAVAVDLIAEGLKKKNPKIRPKDVNDDLWLESQKKIQGIRPYHLTRTTAY